MGRVMLYAAANSNEFWDYNLIHRDLDGTAAADSFAREIRAGRNATSENYPSLAAWKASASFETSKSGGARRGPYPSGFEGHSTDTAPAMPSLDNFPTGRFNYRPSPTGAVTTATSSSLSGADWWSPPPAWGATYFPWNEGAMALTPSAWKGALDPNGTAMPVGVQNR